MFEKIKSSFNTRVFKAGAYSLVSAVVILGIVIAANVIVGGLPSKYTQLDLTSNSIVTLSDETKDKVSSLQDDVTIYWMCQSGQEDERLGVLVNRYKDLSSHISVENIDPDVYPTFAQQYGYDEIDNNSFIVVLGSRYYVVEYDDIYVSDYSSYYTTGTVSYTFYGEVELTSAIDYVTRTDLPVVYMLSGHGEADLNSTFESVVEKANYSMMNLSIPSEGGIPDDADLVFINCPETDITEDEQEALREYLEKGGRLMLITDPLQDTASLVRLHEVMSDYGVTSDDGVIIEGDSSYYAWSYPYYLLPDIAYHEITDSLIQNNYYVLLPISHGLTVADTLPDGVEVTRLLSTTNSSYLKAAGYNITTYEKEEGDLPGSFALAVAIEDSNTNAEIVWISCGSITDANTNEQISGGNQDFFLNCLNWLSDQEESNLSIHAKTLSTEFLTMSDSSASLYSILIVGVIPAASVIIGITVWLRRRKR